MNNRRKARGQLLSSVMMLLSGCVAGGGSGTTYDFDGDGVQDQDDCDPADPNVYPGATDPYGNDIDEDCDGADGDASDLDNDGEGNETDCGPEDATIYPGANDLYGDDIDQNCDGNDGVDSDGDGYPSPGNGVPPELEDCNDSDSGINPGADENPNSSSDEDCDGFGRPLTLQIIPDEARTADALVLQITTDAVVYDIDWSVDGVPRPEYAGFTTISAGQTSKDQLWSVQVLPYDSEGQPGEAASASRTILNTAPEATLLLGLEPGPAEGDSLATVVMVADADGDDIELSNAWMVNAVQVNTEPWLGEIDSSYFDKGDEIWALVTPNDGTEDGAVVETNHVFAINTVPSAASVSIDPTSGDETTVFTCLATGWTDPDPADAEAYDYNWTVDGQVVASTATISGTSFDRGEALICQATPNDGEATGTTLTSLPVIVGNSPPTATAAALSPAAPTEADTVTVTVTGWADPDPGDVENYHYGWHVDGQLVTGNGGPTIDGATFDKGQEIYVEVHPHDGIDLGVAVVSNTVTAANTPPQISTVELNPDPANTLSTLTPQVTGWFDPDPADSPGYTYQWWVNTTTDSGQGTTLGSSSFVKNDEVLVEVVPTDGEDLGTAVSSAALVIANQAPSAPTIAITPAQPTEEDPLVCSITTPSWDPDVDDGVDPTLTYNFNWTQGSTAQSVWDESGLPESGTATVDSSATLAGETWTCEVAAWDSEEEGAPSSEQVTLSSSFNGTCHSVAFDGVDDYGTIGGPLDLGSEATYEMWLHGAPDQAYLPSGRPLLRTNCASINWSTQGIIVEQWPDCSGTGSGYDNPWTPVDIGLYPTGWWHLAVTIDTSHTISVYVDGDLKGTKLLGSSSWGGTYPGSLAATYSQNGVVSGFTAVTFNNIRVSEGLQYTSSFVPNWPLTAEIGTDLLYAFEEGTGQALVDGSTGGADANLIGGQWSQTCPGEDNDADGFPAWQDCDDDQLSVYPGATEIAGDGIDQDCDGTDAVPCTSISLNGTSDWVDVPDLSNGSAWTFEAWIDLDWSSAGYIYHSNCHQLDFNPSGRLSAHTYPGCNGTSTQNVMRLDGVDFASLPSGWQHIAVSTDGTSEAHFFSNGALIGTASSSTDGGLSSINNGGLGAHVDNGTVNGFLDAAFSEVRISNSQRYTAPFTPASSLVVDTATVAHYGFDEQTGNLVADSTGTNDATLISGSWETECHFENVDGDAVPSWMDCDDDDASIYPGATEIVGDGIDQDCDGSDGAPCNSIYLNGTSDWIDVPDLSNGSAWTFEAWMDFDWAVGGYLYHTNCHQLSFNPSGSFNATTYPGCNGTGTKHVMELYPVNFASLPSGWQHIAVSTDGSSGASFFSNGTLIGSSDSWSDNVSGSYNGGLGGRTAGGTPEGFVEVAFAEVRISNSNRYTTSFTPTTSLPVDAATVAHYDLNELSGNLVADSTGNFDATLISGTWQSECHLDNADGDSALAWLDCDDNDAQVAPGTTEVVSDNIDQDCSGEDAQPCASLYQPHATTPSLPWLDADGWTLEAWLRVDSLGTDTDFIFRGWGTCPGAGGMSLNLLNDGKLQLHGGSPGSSAYSDPLSLGTWHHVAVEIYSSGGRLYIDGVHVGTSGGTSGMTCPLEIGGGNNAGGNNGLYIDDARITAGARYGTAFSPPTTLTSDADTIAHYDLGGGSSNSIPDLSGFTGAATLTTGTAAATCRNSDTGTSCLDILDSSASIGDDVYWIDPDGTGGFQAWCDMSTDGGGWTSFFTGTNGAANVFSTFEDNQVVCSDPASSCLRPPSISALSAAAELGIRCGSTMVKAAMNADLLTYFASGIQSNWVSLAPTTTIDGSLSSSADISGFWTGTSGAANPGWMVSEPGGGNRPTTFATSYLDSSYDYCNASADSSSDISLSYRGVSSGGTWHEQALGVNVELRDVFAVSASRAYAVGESGSILVTLDGGTNWSPQSSGTTSFLRGVHFVSNTQGWIVGDDSTILMTADGGSTWTAQTSPVSGALYGVHFVDSTNGAAVGDNGLILRTTDGGTSWTDVSPSGVGTSRLRKVAFGSAGTGWTVGHGDLVLSTTDSGASWNTQSHPGSTPVWFGLDAIDANTAWACGQTGNVIATTDGGASWVSQGTNASVSLNEVSFADANTGWIAGDSGEVYATVDGGSNWDLQPTPGTGHLFSVSFADNENGWAVGAGGVIIHTTSGGD